MSVSSLSTLLSPFDDVEIYCESHNIPCIGLCVEYLCPNKVQFLCMKCIKEGNTCITTKKHELVSLSEFLFRFFIKQENKTIDLMEIQNMIETIKDSDPNELQNTLKNFLILFNEKINVLSGDIEEIINDGINKFNKENESVLSLIQKDAQKIKDNIESIKKFSNFSLSKNLIDFGSDLSLDKLPMTMTQEDKTQLINNIKFLTQKDTTYLNLKYFEKAVELNKLTNLTPESKSTFSNKIDSIISKIESDFDKQLSDLEENLLPQKDESMFIPHNNFIKFNSNPENLVFKTDICSTAHKINSINCVFSTFVSFTGETLVVWGTPLYSIEVYSLDKEKIIKTISNAHSQTIFSCRHYVNKKAKKEYIITSGHDHKVKVWDMRQNWENIVNIQNAHSSYYIYSVSILCDDKTDANYIISSAPNEKMKIWDFSGKLLNSVGANDESTYFIDVFYEVRQKQYYIINANSVDVKVYEFSTTKLYKNYKGTPHTWHMSATVVEIKKVYTLIESDGNGYIRMWDFHSGALLKTISTNGSINLRGIVLWNEDYIFSSGSDYKVRLYDLKNQKFVKDFPGHTSTVCSVEKIVHPKYGEALISHGLDGKLKLWIQK